MRSGRRRRATYNDARNAVLGIAVALQVLRNGNEDTGRESHVEYPVVLLATLLKLLHVLLELNEGLVLIVLAGNIRAEAAKLLQLLLQFLCRGLDVGLDALEVLLMVHLRPRISDNADVLWEEVVAVLLWWSMKTKSKHGHVTYEAEERGELGTLLVTYLLHQLALTYCLLLCQITGGAQNNDDGVVLELHVARMAFCVSCDSPRPGECFHIHALSCPSTDSATSFGEHSTRRNSTPERLCA
jgi:hypothetical protein